MRIDDCVLAPLTDAERRDLLEVLEDRSERTSTLIASQLPPTAWHAAIGEPSVADAICDRVIHHAHRLTLKGRRWATRAPGVGARPRHERDRPPTCAAPRGFPPAQSGCASTTARNCWVCASRIGVRHFACRRGSISPVSRRHCTTRCTHARLTRYSAATTSAFMPSSQACNTRVRKSIEYRSHASSQQQEYHWPVLRTSEDA